MQKANEEANWEDVEAEDGEEDEETDLENERWKREELPMENGFGRLMSQSDGVMESKIKSIAQRHQEKLDIQQIAFTRAFWHKHITSFERKAHQLSCIVGRLAYATVRTSGSRPRTCYRNICVAGTQLVLEVFKRSVSGLCILSMSQLQAAVVALDITGERAEQVSSALHVVGVVIG